MKLQSFAMEIMNFRRFFVVYCRVYCREVTLMPNYRQAEGHAKSRICSKLRVLHGCYLPLKSVKPFILNYDFIDLKAVCVFFCKPFYPDCSPPIYWRPSPCIHAERYCITTQYKSFPKVYFSKICRQRAIAYSLAMTCLLNSREKMKLKYATCHWLNLHLAYDHMQWQKYFCNTRQSSFYISVHFLSMKISFLMRFTCAYSINGDIYQSFERFIL